MRCASTTGPITRVENYFATGTDAFRNACLAIASGVYDIVLACSASEKLNDRGGRRPSACLGRSAALQEQSPLPGLFALAANRVHAHLQWSWARGDLAKVAVKNHYNGAAQSRRRTSAWKFTEERGARTRR